jgi:hypothetical protein
MPKKSLKPMTRSVYRKSLMDNPVHLMRWLKAQAIGGTPEEAARAVARSEGVTLDTAKKSIQEVDAYRKRNEKTEFDLSIRDLVISAIPQAKETLHGLLAATEMVEVKNSKTGGTDIKIMEDKTTRLEAMRVLNSLMIGLQPKTPQVEVNVSQTNQTANLSGAETYEERLSRLRKQAQEHNLLPLIVAGVPARIDAGEEDEDDGDETEDEI